jgi:hypothetical protein
VSRGEPSLAHFAQHRQSMRCRVMGGLTYGMGASFGVSVLA